MLKTLELPDLDGATVSRLHALADGNRFRILKALRQGERCVCHLTESLGMGQPLLSHHLKVLKDAGLVSSRREGRWVHYSIVPEAFRELEELLEEIRRDAAAGSKVQDPC